MSCLSPVIVVILGLAGCVWTGLEAAPIPFAFFAFVLAAGIYAPNFTHSGQRCHECNQPLFTYPRYPNPPEYRCTNRRCEQCAIPRGGERVPTFAECGGL